MKKILLSLFSLILLTGFSFAACPCRDNCNCEKKNCEREKCAKTCDKCSIDDDEYCIFNQCWLDKHYRKMKIALCLSQKQENCIDNIYKNFKADMENQHMKYIKAKNNLLKTIECNNNCTKEQKRILKSIKKETREKIRDFEDEIKQQLCKDQIRKFNKFQRCEKRKMKKLVKYGKVIKLPCVDCCKKTY